MRRRLPFLAWVLPFLATGCSSPGELVQRHEPMSAVGITHVTTAGTYGLFIAGEGEPLLRYPLQAGDRIGFETAVKPATDQLQIEWLYGVAGAARGRLDHRKTYEWRLLPDQD